VASSSRKHFDSDGSLIVTAEAGVAVFHPDASDFHVAEKLNLGGMGHVDGRGGVVPSSRLV
jgi:hypothetical protein